MTDDVFERGLKIRKEVLGEEYVERSLKNADAFSMPFQELVTRCCWGETWGRAGLSRKQRSLNNLCITAAGHRMHEFKLHFGGALDNGCSLVELRETLLQIAVYAGIPAGVEVFRIAREVFEERGIDPGAELES